MKERPKKPKIIVQKRKRNQGSNLLNKVNLKILLNNLMHLLNPKEKGPEMIAQEAREKTEKKTRKDLEIKIETERKNKRKIRTNRRK